MSMTPLGLRAGRTLFGLALLGLTPASAAAHCDTMDGPVVAAARVALEKGDVTPVLRWILPEFEPEIRRQFAATLTVRAQGPAARELADLYFFETVVRLHRQGEKVPYSGILPAGTPLDPVVAWTDQALESGSADALVKLVTQQVESSIRSRYTQALEKKKAADDSVAAGRAFVESYVEYTHFVERLYHAALGEGQAPAEPPHGR